MITYHPEQQIVVMDLVDLDHCSFDHDEFDDELTIRGITEQAARFPFAIVVNVAGGHLIPQGTPEEQARAYDERHEQFQQWMKLVREMPSLLASIAYVLQACSQPPSVRMKRVLTLIDEAQGKEAQEYAV